MENPAHTASTVGGGGLFAQWSMRLLYCGLFALGLTMAALPLMRGPQLVLPDRIGAAIGNIDERQIRERTAEAARWFDRITAINGVLLLLLAGVRLFRRPGLRIHVPTRRAAASAADARAQAVEFAGVARHRTAGLLCLLTLASVVLRMPGLCHGMWYDEIYTVQSYLSADWRGIATDYAAPNNHILFTLLLKGWDGLLPGSVSGDARVTAWRWLSVILGALCVPLMWRLAREAATGRRERNALAWLAAAATAAWPLAVDVSQQLRGYAPAMLLAAAATVLFRHAWERRGGWSAYVLAAAALVYTQPMAAVVLAGHVAAVAIEAARSRAEIDSRQATRSFLLALLLMAMIVAQLYAMLIPDALRNAREQADPQVRHLTAGAYVLECCKAIGARAGPTWASVPIALLLIPGAVRLVRQSRPIGAVIVVPPMLLLVVALLWPPMRQTRFLPLAAPHLMLLLCLGALSVVNQIDRAAGGVDPRTRQPGRSAMALVARALPAMAVCLASVAGLRDIYALPVQAIREAMRHAARHGGGHTVVMGLGAAQCTYYDPAARKAFGAEQLREAMRRGSVSRVVLPFPRTWLGRAEQEPLRQLLEVSFEEDARFAGRLAEDPNVIVYRLK